MLEQQLDVLVLEDALDLDRHRTARVGLPGAPQTQTPAGRHSQARPPGSTLEIHIPLLPDHHPRLERSRPSWPLHENRCYVKSGRGQALALSRPCRPDRETTPLLNSWSDQLDQTDQTWSDQPGQTTSAPLRDLRNRRTFTPSPHAWRTALSTGLSTAARKAVEILKKEKTANCGHDLFRPLDRPPCIP